MTKERIAPLPADVLAVVTAARTIDAVPAETRARLRTRMLASVGALPHAPRTGALAPASLKGVIALSLAIGVGAGIGLTLGAQAIFRSPPPVMVVAHPIVSAPVLARNEERPDRQAAPREPEEVVHTTPAVAVAPRRAEPRRPRALPVRETVEPEPIAPAVDTIAAQRALIEQARRALATRRLADATSALDAHDEQFPNGRYAEESEALRVRVLLANGRTSEANQAATRFLERHPHSIFREVVTPAR